MLPLLLAPFTFWSWHAHLKMTPYEQKLKLKRTKQFKNDWIALPSALLTWRLGLVDLEL